MFCGICFFEKHQALPALVDVFNVAEWVFGILFLEARHRTQQSEHHALDRCLGNPKWEIPKYPSGAKWGVVIVSASSPPNPRKKNQV